ncbi:MAG: putative tail tip protein M [Prokaryotic dsDNA virus sp.]|nr:MAG: putative tail tip protein M [Prokaryotic dsDNA virus sp.]|tara:strand:+ start:8410 stop:8760 length:351 start_codon:yes stop_codon:yes gene_type:complete
MANFPSIQPVYGTTKRSTPNVRTIRFADGYEHRLMLGLAAHQNPKIITLKFNVSETDADTIESFLDARAADQASFTFTPPNESSSSQFVCESWTKTIIYTNRATINATFREVFEPA